MSSEKLTTPLSGGKRTKQQDEWFREKIGQAAFRFIAPNTSLANLLSERYKVEELIRIIGVISPYKVDGDPLLLVRHLDSEGLTIETTAGQITENPEDDWVPFADLAKAGYVIRGITARSGQVVLRFGHPIEKWASASSVRAGS
jgi:hypothetical protein